MESLRRKRGLERQARPSPGFLLMLILLPSMALAAGAEGLVPPQQVIEATADELLHILERDRERIQQDPAYIYRLANRIIIPHVDVQRMSRLALGKYWRRISRSQRKRFGDEFRRLLVRTYAVALKEFGRQAEIRFIPMQLEEGARDLVVRTRVVHPRGDPLALDFRMHHSHGSWLTYDIKIEGVSLVTSYRSSFARDIRQRGIEKLIARLAESNAKKFEERSQQRSAGDRHD